MKKSGSLKNWMVWLQVLPLPWLTTHQRHRHLCYVNSGRYHFRGHPWAIICTSWWAQQRRHPFLPRWWYPLPQKNPLSITTAFPVPSMVSHISTMIPTVFSSSDYFLAPISAVLSLHYTIFALHIVLVMSHAMVCLSFANVWYLRLTYMKPGSHLLYHSTMGSSRTLLNNGKNGSVIFWSHTSSYCFIGRKPSSYGTSLLLYQWARRISLSWFQCMIWWSRNGAPLFIKKFVVYHQYQKFGTPTHKSM